MTLVRYFDELPPLEEVAQSWDMSFKDTTESDYVVNLVAGRQGSDIYFIDRVKGQWGFSEKCRQVRALTAKYPQASTVLIEDAANGPASSTRSAMSWRASSRCSRKGG